MSKVRCADRIRHLAELLGEAARWNDVVLLDWYHAFAGQAKTAGAGFFLPDGLHPSTEGHRLIAEQAAVVLRSALAVNSESSS
jgi:lysophospholipase L1-like esterase